MEIEIETQPPLARTRRSRSMVCMASIACAIGIMFSIGVSSRLWSGASQVSEESLSGASHVSESDACPVSNCSTCAFASLSANIDMGNVTCQLTPVLNEVHRTDYFNYFNFIPEIFLLPRNMTKCQAKNNTNNLNCALKHLRSLDHAVPKTLRVPGGYYVMAGGINANLLHNFTWNMTGAVFDFAACVTARSGFCKINNSMYGELASFSDTVVKDVDGNEVRNNLKPAISVCGVESFEWFGAQLRGGGGQWYGLVDFAVYGDKRGTTKPILVDGYQRCNEWKDNSSKKISRNVEIYNFTIYYPPYWSTYFYMEHSSIHDGQILAERRPFSPTASPPERFLRLLYDNILDFNTDGIDIAGRFNHVYNMNIRVGDDIVAMKGGTDMLFENITGEGAGLSVGTEKHGDDNGRNITFRNCVLENTLRAIYVKTDAKYVVYENIEVGTATLFPIWVGPAYQGITKYTDKTPCSLVWPFLPAFFLTIAESDPQQNVLGINALTCSGGRKNTTVTIRNVNIKNTYSTPVVLFGTPNTTLQVIMENVTLPENVSSGPFTEVYKESFLISPSATCRDANLTVLKNSVSPASVVQSCKDGGYQPLSSGKVGNGVSLCSNGSFTAQNNTGLKDFFGVCDAHNA